MKRHMEAAREVLREAESWSTLELEVTSLLGEQSYAKAAERFSEASESTVAFQNTPEYEPQRTHHGQHIKPTRDFPQLCSRTHRTWQFAGITFPSSLSVCLGGNSIW
jgi:hypothetical protein